jgi:Helicase associated domain
MLLHQHRDTSQSSMIFVKAIIARVCCIFGCTQLVLVLFLARTSFINQSSSPFCRAYSSEVTTHSDEKSVNFRSGLNYKNPDTKFMVPNEDTYGRNLNLQASYGDPTDVRHGVWFLRYQQLLHYKMEEGHTRVPKRFVTNPSLGNWVNKQRQYYQNYQLGKTPCSLTEQRIELLNRIGFCWNGVLKERSTEGSFNCFNRKLTCLSKNGTLETDWAKKFEQLCSFINATHDNINAANANIRKVDRVPRHSQLGRWLHQQRLNYRRYVTRSSTSSYNNFSEKFDALEAIDSYWYLGRREYQWEYRFRQLQEYKQVHGDCCVPISYEENKQLGQWVSNQRKNFGRFTENKSSSLSDEKVCRLKEIGFAFNRWEYEFGRKLHL